MATARDYLSEQQINCVYEFSDLLARDYAKLRLKGVEHPQISFALRSGHLRGVLRASKNNAIWINIVTQDTEHNCVSSRPTATKGIVVQARFDADNFVKWIEEELTEALIRWEIISRINAAKHDNLASMISMRAKRAAMKSGGCSEILGILYVRQ